MTFVLKYVEALKGLHRADIVLECNSLKNFSLHEINKFRNSGNFGKTLKMRVKLILNCPRAHAIIYTKPPGGSNLKRNGLYVFM